MTHSRQNTSNGLRLLSREKLLLILHTAYDTGSLRFLRQAALSWLSIYPGDLAVNLMLARALITEGRLQQAFPILEKLCRLDPEFGEAQEILALAAQELRPDTASQALASAHALNGQTQLDVSMPVWIRQVRGARAALAAGRLDEMDKLVQQMLISEPDQILAAVLHLELTTAKTDAVTIINLARVYRTRWPDCLQFALLQAHAQLENGDESGSVELLHHCVVNDASAQVASRLWGPNFPYRPLWPESLEIVFDLPIPAEIAGRLGLNLLPAGEAPQLQQIEDIHIVHLPSFEKNDPNVPAEMPTDEEPVFPFLESLLRQEELTGPEMPPPGMEFYAGEEAHAVTFETPDVTAPATVRVPEMAAGQAFSEERVEQEVERANHGQAAALDLDLRGVQEEFERLAKRIKRPELSRADGRYPIYIILTTEGGMSKQYGEGTLSVVTKELEQLAEVVRRRPDWGALLMLPDNGENMARLGLAQVESLDPWKIKLALVDLDHALGKKGERIGALIIVGGNEVVPFHMLPNPTDDHDVEIASDNPYGTLDSNYFIQDWPVGRLPGEVGSDAGLLLEQIRQVIRYHSKVAPAPSRKLGVMFWQNLQDFLNHRGGKATFGYTAAVWRRSSLAVFRTIGDAHALVASPPESSGTVKGGKPTANLAYYNLHGLADSAEWYGQRDTTDVTPGPDYPVAMSPKDISGKGVIPNVVFSEACYGALVTGKTEDQSMALKFLSQGVLSLVGSTAAAYGSVSMPLIGADLLGNYFWKNLKNGRTAGEALLQAKIDLVREMNKRQGFLDGEDQKTLISFVLFGDPLVAVSQFGTQHKSIQRPALQPMVKTICDRQENGSASKVSAETMKKVKDLVAEYLPGLTTAQIHVHGQHIHCDGKGHTCPTSQMVAGSIVKGATDPTHVVVTISNEVKVGTHVHQQYARVTLDERGKMVKLAVSR